MLAPYGVKRLFLTVKQIWNGVIEMTQFDHEHFMQAVGNADEINELLRRYGVK